MSILLRDDISVLEKPIKLWLKNENGLWNRESYVRERTMRQIGVHELKVKTSEIAQAHRRRVC